MKIIKSLIAIMVLSAIVMSCRETNKEEATESMDSMESAEYSSDEKKEKKKKEMKEDAADAEEMAGFSYTVNYAKDAELAGAVDATIKHLLEKYPDLDNDFMNAYGFAIFPKITKAGFVLGGAGGNGLVFENDAVIGISKMSQATIGFQAGGQQYTQAMFFQNKEALDQFTNGKFKFSSEASAVILESGASVDISYYEGMAALIESEKGAMFEASLGTQKFKFE